MSLKEHRTLDLTLIALGLGFFAASSLTGNGCALNSGLLLSPTQCATGLAAMGTPFHKLLLVNELFSAR